MSVTKFKFVSPGVFIDEIDNSQIPGAAPAMGPVIIGRTERGPAFRPTQVNSFSEFIEKFGNPIPGGIGGDVWREGNRTSPMYATYAAQAWLKNGQTATIVRLLGMQATNATAGGDGEAGWGGYSRASYGGGAYGLFLIDSGAAGTNNTGTLAAVWYFPDGNGAIVLSGTFLYNHPGTLQTASNATLLRSIGTNQEFKATITTGSTGQPPSSGRLYSFNFNPNSDKFIRKVFNTNPILTNTGITESGNQEKYWLGQTYERAVADTIAGTGEGGNVGGIMLGLQVGTTPTNFSDFQGIDAQPASTGWIISQDTRGTAYQNFNPRDTTYVTKLFKVHAIEKGVYPMGNFKISIANIKASPNAGVDPYGTFDLIIRRAQDTDNAIQVVESFLGLSLNPNAENYIAKRIGDMFDAWDDSERRFREYGSYLNISKYIRVEMNNELDMGSTDPSLLPFGFHGPFRPTMWHFDSGSGQINPGGSGPAFGTGSSLTASGEMAGTVLSASGIHWSGMIQPANEEHYSNSQQGYFKFPDIALRYQSNDDSMGSDKDAYFGYTTNQSGTNRYDHSNKDVLRMLPANVNTDTTNIEIGVAFTLDDLQVASGVATYVSGARAAGSSLTAQSGAYADLIDTAGFNKFTVPMWGGFDGVQITESDPFANRNIGSTEVGSYVFNTLKRSIDACSDAEHVDFNTMVMPGITNTTLTEHMVNICEDRSDALAIIDLPDVYNPPHEGTSYASFGSRLASSLDTTVTNFKNRYLNSSYGCTYYPWVQIKDSINGAVVWVPPSVVALGAFASSERRAELWFAPAGFNRGGLSNGAAGLSVINIVEKLTSGQRDKLYDVNINPIASFPNEGLVIFGQKTMQTTKSALDRINVRRLLIFLKKEVSRLSKQVLFDPNLRVTWDRFRGLVEPLLESVKIRFGLSDYRLILDETTTTPEMIDRNVMYAKILLKPARAIEFIAIDFVIERTGASFGD